MLSDVARRLLGRKFPYPTFLIGSEVSPPNPPPPPPPPPIDSMALYCIKVTDYGVVADSTYDNTVAFQNIINNAVSGTLFCVPRGNYKVTGTLDFSRLGAWAMRGTIAQGGGNDGTVIIGGTPGQPLVKSIGNNFHVDDMRFVGKLDVGSSAFYTQNTNGVNFTRCAFAGRIGLDARDPFLTSCIACSFNGQNGRLSDAGSHIGLQVSGATDFSCVGCDWTGWHEGVRAAGSGLSILASRFEVNGIGMHLGYTPTNDPSALTASSFHGITCEANDTAILCQVLGSCEFGGFEINGTDNSPSAGSYRGIDIQTVSQCIWQAFRVGGAYSDSGLYLRPTNSENKRLVFMAGQVDNVNEAGQKWNLPTSDLRDATFIETDAGV